MRKKAQEKKRGEAASSSTATPSSSSSVHSSISVSSKKHEVDPHASKKAGEESFYDTGGASTQDEGEGEFSMDDIWKDIDMSEENNSFVHGESEQVVSPSASSWEYCCCDPLWVMMDEESLFMSEPYFYALSG